MASSVNMSAKAKSYIQKRQIQELFQALMTGLMFKQPEDHIDFIIKNMKMIKDKKITDVNWSTFLNDETEKDAKINLNTKYNEPLPPIPKVNVKVPIVFLMNVPGLSTLNISKELSKAYIGLKIVDVNAHFPVDHGNPVITPSKTVFEYLLEEFSKFHREPTTKGYLIAGFPRTLKEITDFGKFVNRIDLGILIDSNDDQVLIKHFKNKSSDEVKELLNNFNDNKEKLKTHFSKHSVCQVLNMDDDEHLLIENSINIVSNVFNVQIQVNDDFKKVNVKELSGEGSRNPDNAPELHK